MKVKVLKGIVPFVTEKEIENFVNSIDNVKDVTSFVARNDARKIEELFIIVSYDDKGDVTNGR